MKALVTGVAGFIGSHLAERLLEAGHQVVGIDGFTESYPREVKAGNIASLSERRNFRFVETTIHDAPWPRLLDGVTHVFHLAGRPGARGGWGGDFAVYTRNNVDATQILLEACASVPLERVVYASSASVYGERAALPMREDDLPQPLSPDGVTKLAAEHLCILYHAAYGVPAVSLRYFTVYGPRQRPDMAFHRYLYALLRGHPIAVYGDGDQTRDFTFVEDAVSATVAAGRAGAPGRVYNVGGGTRASLNDAIELMARCAGRRPTVQRHAAQRGDVRDTCADITRARTDLGFVPTVTLEKGIQAEYQWLATSLAPV
jgi:nucleoside-diphosphate-sugar epimerase